MAGILEGLRSDHSRMTKLLDALERQIDRFSEGGTLDFDIADGILHYCQVYPDLHHHPREDRVYGVLQRRAPEVTAELGDLRDEHRKLVALTGLFAEALTAVEQDIPMKRNEFTDVAREFLSAYRRHILMEEKYFFPAAEKHLRPTDWQEISAQVGEVADPLFDQREDDRFDALYEDIVAWDSILPIRA